MNVGGILSVPASPTPGFDALSRTGNKPWKVSDNDSIVFKRRAGLVDACLSSCQCPSCKNRSLDL